MAASNSNKDQSPSLEFVEELQRRRRRQRWSAFLTPLITLGSLVISISLMMFFIRACGERLPHDVLLPQGGARLPADGPPGRPQHDKAQ